MQKTPITAEGLKKLENELNHLIKVEREQLKKAIAEARAQGDLSENADYQFAKEKQSHVEGRIGALQGIIASAQVINPAEIKNDTVVFGATVTIFDQEKETETVVQIVGKDESDSGKGKISINSPLAMALIGKSVGDTVVVRAPKGNIEYEILDLKYI